MALAAQFLSCHLDVYLASKSNQKHLPTSFISSALAMTNYPNPQEPELGRPKSFDEKINWPCRWLYGACIIAITTCIAGQACPLTKTAASLHFKRRGSSQNFIFRTENFFCVLAVEYSLVFNFDDLGRPSLYKNSCPLDQQVGFRSTETGERTLLPLP